MGDPDRAEDRERVKEAARLGGASEYVEKLPKKWDEVLFPMYTGYSTYPMSSGPLKDLVAKIEHQSDLSGE